MRKLLCARDHRMIEIVTDLWLCECSSTGRKAGLLGIDQEARVLVERAGGLGLLRDRVERAEQKEKNARGHGAPGRAGNKTNRVAGIRAGASPTWEATGADSDPDED